MSLHPLVIGRIIILGIFILLTSVIGILYSLCHLHSNNRVWWISRIYGWAHNLIGIDVVLPQEEIDKLQCPKGKNRVYVANHQNSFDMFTICIALPQEAVSIGKKTLMWIPFFGQLYWLTGNILIDRKNGSKAMDTISDTVSKMKSRKLSVWIFPEGTRSRGRLKSFKTGAFRMAQMGDFEIVPICMSSTDHFSLSNWKNGVAKIKVLDPIAIGKDDSPRVVADKTFEKMQATIAGLDKALGNPDLYQLDATE